MDEPGKTVAALGEAYITGALTALEEAPRTKLFYEVIAEIAEGAKLRAYLPHRVTDPVAAANIEPRTVYEIDRAHIAAARVVIAYAGVPSFGVGIEVELAREHGVPVILVAERERSVSRLLLGSPAVVEVVRFADLDGLRRGLVAALTRVAAIPLDGPRPQVADDVVVQRFIASLEHARQLPDAEIVALLRVGELDGEAATAVRDAVAKGRLFGAGLRDLVGRHALRGVDLAVFVLRDILERSLADTSHVVGLDTRATKRRLAAARAPPGLAEDAEAAVVAQWLVAGVIPAATRGRSCHLFAG